MELGKILCHLKLKQVQCSSALIQFLVSHKWIHRYKTKNKTASVQKEAKNQFQGLGDRQKGSNYMKGT